MAKSSVCEYRLYLGTTCSYLIQLAIASSSSHSQFSWVEEAVISQPTTYPSHGIPPEVSAPSTHWPTDSGPRSRISPRPTGQSGPSGDAPGGHSNAPGSGQPGIGGRPNAAPAVTEHWQFHDPLHERRTCQLTQRFT